MRDIDDLDLLEESSQKEPETSIEYSSQKAEENDLDTQRMVSEIEDAIQNREERKRYARLAYRLAVGWLAAIVIMVVLQGFGFEQSLNWSFNLSDGVLITFIGTNTASVIGVLVVVVRYLFPRR